MHIPTPFERAKQIAENKAIAGHASAGRSIVTLLQTHGLSLDHMTTEELRLLATGANWCCEGELALRAMTIAVRREPDNVATVEAFKAALQYAYSGDSERYLHECARCIEESIGPASVWHLARAWEMFDHATGDRDEQEPYWDPNQPVKHPARIKAAAEEFRLALNVDPQAWERLDAEQMRWVRIAIELAEKHAS